MSAKEVMFLYLCICLSVCLSVWRNYSRTCRLILMFLYERIHIEYKLLSLTYKAPTTAQPTYLHSLISVRPPRVTRSSSVVTLSRPPTSSSLRTTNRSFRYASPHLWNQLPLSFRQPCIKHPADDVTLSKSPPTCSPLSPSITHSLFHSRLKTHLFHKSFPP